FTNITVSEMPKSPVAAFSSNVTDGYAPLTVQFTDLSANAAEWNWNFGDGETSTVQNPAHTYSTAGEYNATLTVANANGTGSSSSTITAFEPVLPAAAFSSNTTSGNAPLTVQFTDLSENAAKWNWDFGEGNSSSEQSPANTYYTPGNYTTILTVANANGTDSKFTNITVSEMPKSPVAAFSSNVTDGYAPLTVQFMDLSENAEECNWNFGDETASSEQNPVHTYSVAGNYTVSLTVNNEDGQSTETGSIAVNENP
ncbi:PKD domain-containing protein, partial [Methanosarcina mazei]